MRRNCVLRSMIVGADDAMVGGGEGWNGERRCGEI